MFKPTKTSLAHAMLAAACTMLPMQGAQAAPGTLPKAPLFLSTIVEPNVYFTLDDSGSMEYGPIYKTGVAGLSTYNGLPIIDGDDRAYYVPGEPRLYTTRGYLPPSQNNPADIVINGSPTDPKNVIDKFVAAELDEWDKSWVARTHHGNRNYYNPAIEYKPWPGSRADGTPMYVAADPRDALLDPNDSSSGVDLLADYSYTSEEFKAPGGDFSITNDKHYLGMYFIWDDDIKIPYDANGLLDDVNGDGIVDSDDGDPVAPNGELDIDDGRRQVLIPRDANDPAMLNFANWFQYYRQRIGTTKAILGATINNTDAARMGMRLFNDGPLERVGTSIDLDIESMTDINTKREMLESLYDIEISARGTPARAATVATGDLFRSKTSGAILSKADGGECQQNFNILMSDGYWNSFDSPGVGNTDADGPGPFDGGPYADAYSDTLADVTMDNYENDLRDDLDDRVPTITGVDEANHQHLVTYTVAFGISGSLDPTTDPASDGFVWPEPVRNTETTVDDMWHAAYNSRGRYLNAQDPEQLQESISSAVRDISERTGTAAAVAINSAQLSLESVVYLAQFNSNRWQGNLLAFPIIDTDTGELAATPKWDASAALNGRNLVSDPREIVTYNNDPGVRDGVPFVWTDTFAPLSSAMEDDLRTSPAGGVDSDAVARARVDYLRGDRSDEGAGNFFRERLSLLGDIVNSGPVFVGEPSLAWPDFDPFPEGSAAYSEFKNGPARNRKKVVYSGANDGLLRAFDDANGREIFAYLPGMFSSTSVAEGLHYLTDPNYTHNFYVDQTPTLSDIYYANDWHTVLVGALRSGGRGVFALDVTDPEDLDESNADKIVLWEFSSDDDADLGYTFSRPFIALTNSGDWVAIFGNGYNDLGSGEASLFIVDIVAGIDGSWTTGDYRKISTGVGTSGDRNGLATPALADVDGNGTVDIAYAGDLRGNMWAFDLSSDNASQWDVAYKSGSIALPLFTTPANQPITAKPVLAKHPTQPDSQSPSNAPNIMVYFGTGQYLVDADKSSTDVQSFYGVWDTGDDSLLQSDLIEQTFDNTFSVKVLTRNAVDYSTDHGWYFNLPETGERAVTSPIARADTVFFNSFVPVDDPCSIGGFGFRFAVDMTTGGSPLEPSFDRDMNGEINEDDTVSNGISTSTQVAVRQEGFLPEPVFIEDLAFTADEATKVKALKDIPVGRFSWQELIQ